MAVPDEWHLIGADGERVVKVSGPIVTSHRHGAARPRRCAGLASPMARSIFSATISMPAALPVLPNYQLPEATIYAVYPVSKQLSAKVKVFNDFITRYFAENYRPLRSQATTSAAFLSGGNTG